MGNKNLHIFFNEIISSLANGKDSPQIFMPEFLPKQQIQTNWFALTGPPCAGKTTVIKALESLGLPVIHERGRFVIESALAEGFSTDEIFSSQQLLQETILKAKIIAHLENPPLKLTILEDGIPESLAYFRIENLEIAAISHIFNLFRYQKIFYLDALPLINDPARPHSQEKTDLLGEMKKQIHLELGYEVIEIPVLPLPERIDLILKHPETGKIFKS
jgi:predicted ATPase